MTRDMEDPSRRGDRIANEEASSRALRILRRADPQRFQGFSVVHVAFSRRGELGPEARWLVLCDPASRGLQGSVVVELRASDGSLIRVRDATVKGVRPQFGL